MSGERKRSGAKGDGAATRPRRSTGHATTRASGAAPTSAAPSDAAPVVYLYCLLLAKRRPATARLPTGVPAATAPRLVPLGEAALPGHTLYLVCADVPVEEYGAEPIERGLRDLEWVSARALGHEALVEACARLPSAAAVVPMKLFTLFATEARAVAHVRGERARLERALRRVAGRDEWGVRVRLDEVRARRRAEERAWREVGGARGGTGAAFLRLKQQQQQALLHLASDARHAVDRLHGELGRFAEESQRRPPVPEEAGARLLLEGAYLVGRTRARRFEAAVRGAAQRLLDDGIEVTLTGPWPAYHFVE